MSRTESTSFQVHPNDEQRQIDLMQKFHWNLLNTQEIKTVDNHMELRGDTTYSVTNTEHYVKLSFSRELETPNLAEIKNLENQYNNLPVAKYPVLFPVAWWLWAAASLVYGLGAIGWIAYYFALYSPKKTAADELESQNEQKRTRIMTELAQYG